MLHIVLSDSYILHKYTKWGYKLFDFNSTDRGQVIGGVRIRRKFNKWERLWVKSGHEKIQLAVLAEARLA